MLMLSFFSWWYGRGWGQVAASFKPRLLDVSALFSVHQLVRTLFAPWRRIISYPGASLDDKVKAWADNLFSRVIGFVVRFVVLIAALATLALVAILTVVEVIIWPLLPATVPVLLLAGLTT